METSELTTFQKIYPIFIQKYESFLPSEENAGVTEKINSMIQYMSQIGRLNNDVVANWNKVMKWTLDEGLTETIDTKIDKMVVDNVFDVVLKDLVDTKAEMLQTILEDLRETGTGFDAQARNDLVAVNSKITDISKVAIPYGKIKMPSDFVPTLPCNFYRDFDGKVKHNMDFNQYKTGTSIYVDLVLGSDTTGNGTTGLPYKTIKKAGAVASAGVDSAYVIRVKSKTVFYRDESADLITLTDKTVSIIPDNPSDRIVMTAGQKGLTWIEDGTGTWKAIRSSVYAIFDLSEKDMYGVYKPTTSELTLGACQTKVGSWYTDNVSVWIHTKDGLQPDVNKLIIGVMVPPLSVVLKGSAKLYIENVDVLASNSFDGTMIKGDLANVTGTFIANNCTFSGGNFSPTKVAGNAFATEDLKNCFLFDCKSAYALRDGFNHHYVNIPTNRAEECFSLLYNCISYENGWLVTPTNNNAFTSHEGASVLRINCIGYDTNGPILADVQGCYSICIDTHMRDSRGIGEAYYFGYSGDIGKAVMINCNSGGNVKQDLYSGLATYVIGFKGHRIQGEVNNIHFVDYVE